MNPSETNQKVQETVQNLEVYSEKINELYKLAEEADKYKAIFMKNKNMVKEVVFRNGPQYISFDSEDSVIKDHVIAFLEIISASYLTEMRNKIKQFREVLKSGLKEVG